MAKKASSKEKAFEYGQATTDELGIRLSKTQQELFKIRFRAASAPVKNTMQIRKLRPCALDARHCFGATRDFARLFENEGRLARLDPVSTLDMELDQRPGDGRSNPHAIRLDVAGIPVGCGFGAGRDQCCGDHGKDDFPHHHAG